MTRKEAYELIKKMNLQEVVKNVYGVNYTNVSTDNLIKIIDKSIVQSKLNDANIEEEWEIEFEPCGLHDKFNTLVDILYKKRILLKSEVSAINKV